MPVRHLHVWDDYDRFRKVPAGVDPSWAEHIGRPLSAVPDPWDCHASWAEHFKEPLRDALHAMGVEMEEVSQTERYRAGVYREQVLARRPAPRRHRGGAGPLPHQEGRARAVSEQEAAALADCVADDEDPEGATELARFPFKPYCRDVRARHDHRHVVRRRDDRPRLHLRLCGFTGVTNLATQDEGKLVWKVDWPMRWAFEHVDFEPAGMDHATPGSSFTVGHELVEKVFGMPRPAWFGYGFVGFAGVQKMSSSAGGAPTAADALRVLEAPILRWLYVRRNPKQTFDIDFGPEVVRLYDEWDALARKAADPAKRDAPGARLRARRRPPRPPAPLPTPPVVVPFRLLSSVADVTAGSAEQISRIVGDVGHEHESVDDLEPRLDKAMAWTAEFVARPTAPPCATSPDAARARGARPTQRARVAARCCSTACPTPLDLDAGDRAGLRRAQAGARPGPRRHADRRGQGRPEGVLRAALPPARRRRPRPAAAHAVRGARAPSGSASLLAARWRQSR